MIQIGKYTPASARCPAQIQREFYGQGYIVKDEPTFLSQPDRVCYVPELSDTLYTRRDFLRICNEQPSWRRYALIVWIGSTLKLGWRSSFFSESGPSARPAENGTMPRTAKPARSAALPCRKHLENHGFFIVSPCFSGVSRVSRGAGRADGYNGAGRRAGPAVRGKRGRCGHDPESCGRKRQHSAGPAGI